MEDQPNDYGGQHQFFCLCDPNVIAFRLAHFKSGCKKVCPAWHAKRKEGIPISWVVQSHFGYFAFACEFAAPNLVKVIPERPMSGTLGFRRC
ncbi:hypothetical protein P9761_14850 [Brevibacillus centrosporus]|nr:hypothetical protein [Brevibacillus centrosporus]MEC2132313.1 hypothetical protein [Brevibacillus centrosporus]MED4909464.1 hypothetical protein [Brevibacillus centrosporus]